MTIEEIFKQHDLEKKIKNTIEGVSKKPGRFNEMLDIQFVEYNSQERSVIFELPVNEWELNPVDVLHGGITAAMMDLSLGLFANTIGWLLGGVFSPTVNLNVNYLLPVSLKDKVLVKAQLVSSGRSLLTVNGQAMIKESGQIVATASGTYKVIRK